MGGGLGYFGEYIVVVRGQYNDVVDWVVDFEGDGQFGEYCIVLYYLLFSDGQVVGNWVVGDWIGIDWWDVFVGEYVVLEFWWFGYYGYFGVFQVVFGFDVDYVDLVFWCLFEVVDLDGVVSWVIQCVVRQWCIVWLGIGQVDGVVGVGEWLYVEYVVYLFVGDVQVDLGVVVGWCLDCFVQLQCDNVVGRGG